MQRRPLALLAVLAAAGNLSVSRDKLIAYFWPESDEDRARNVLRQLLHTIRRDLASPDLVVGTSELRLNPALFTSDLADFERACAAGEFESAVGLYRGPFLDGFYLSNAAGFESWKENERTRLARLFTDVAERSARRFATAGDHTRAIGMWQRLAVAEPLNSRIAIELMRAMAEAGDVGGALKHARVHETLLREEVGTPPGPDVSAAIEALRRHSRATPNDNRAAPEPAGGTVPSATPAAPDGPLVGGHAAGPGDSGRGGSARASVWRWSARARIGVAAVVVAIGVGIAALADGRAPTETDRLTYLVVPFAEPSTAGRAAPSALEIDALLRAAFAGWRDVRLADELILDEGRSAGDARVTLQHILTSAQKAGAARVVRPRRVVIGDSVHVRVTVYDVDGQRPVSDLSMVLGPRSNVREAFARLVSDILRGRSGAIDVTTPTAPIGTSLAVAWQAFDSAQRSMASWDLTASERLLRRAIDADAQFPAASVWLAQVLLWRGTQNSDEALRAASRALASSSRLDEKELHRARALSALAQRSHADACDAFRRVLVVDSLDFAAWYGLGDCQARDSVVLADTSSPSGWRFRGSYHAAVRAYTRAFQLSPSFGASFGPDAFSRLSALLFTEPFRYRAGVSADGGDSSMFGAFPSLVGDTLAFIPVRVADLRVGNLRGSSTGRLDAIRRNRSLLREVVAQWVEAEPRSFDALEAYSLAQELNGEIGSDRVPAGALATLRQARAAMAGIDRGRRLRLGASEVRLLLKRGSVADARHAVDSILNSATAPTAAEASQLAALAALTGRVDHAAMLLEVSAPNHRTADAFGRVVESPVPVTAAALRVFAFASFGGPRDSLANAYREFERRLTASVEPTRHEQLRSAHLQRPLRLAFDELVDIGAPVNPTEDPLIRMRIALRGNDTLTARSTLSALIERRRGVSASDVFPDQWYQEARLLLAMRDTAGAVRLLDVGLDALPTAPTNILANVPTAAAIGLALALRAEIPLGDTRRARVSGRAVTALWANADGYLAQRVKRAPQE